MYSSRLRFGVLAVMLLAVNVTGLVWIHHDVTQVSKSKVRVIAALPVRGVDTTDRFSLLFDERVVDPQEVDKTLDRSPFVISPQPAGRWVWAAPERLEYRLDRPLLPGQVFVIRPAADCESQIGRSLAGPAEFKFKTQPLRITSCEIDSSDRTHANVKLRFNQPVHPADLLRHLRVADKYDDSHLHATCLVREPSADLVVRTRRARFNSIRLSIDGDLTGHDGKLPLGEEFTKSLHVSPAFVLLRAEVWTPALDKTVTVDLSFTRWLDRNQTTPKVLVEPPVGNLQVRCVYGSLRLEGAFESGRRYTTTVGPNLLSDEGEVLEERQSLSFDIPDRRPTIEFPLSRGVLSPHGNLSLDVRVVNVAGLDLRAFRVHSNNLLAHLRGEETSATSREVLDRTIRLDLERNTPQTMAVDLGALLNHPRGIYLLEAEATNHTWTEDRVMLAVSDLAITSRQERDGLFVWVTSLSTGQPLEGVAVRALSFNNQTLASGETLADGTVHLTVPANHPDGRAHVVVARLADDESFLVPHERLWVMDGVDGSGREPPQTYDLMLYPDRGVYRPGDTVHLTGIIRDATGEIPPAFPLSVQVVRPDGKTIAELPASAAENGQGVFHLAYASRADGQLGRYRFEATLPGSDRVLGEATALVEAFVPLRMVVEAEATRPRFGPGERPQIHVGGRYLFGQPASALPATATGAYQAEPFHSRQFPQFVFGEPAHSDRIELSKVETALDEAGKASMGFDPPKDRQPGLWRADVAVTVTEPGGRSVSENLSFSVDTADRYVGLLLPAGRLVPADAPVAIEWLLITGSDELATAGPVRVSLERVDYDSVVEQVDGRPVWKSVERLTPVLEQSVEAAPDTPARGSLTITCPTGGLYRVSAVDEHTGSRTTMKFHAAGSKAELESLAMDEPETLEIVLDEDSYLPGRAAKVLVRSPFPGTLLLTLETDRVVHRDVFQLLGSAVALDVPLPSDLRGGAFVTAMVVRGIDPTRDKWLPHRAMGMARLVTQHTDHQLALAIHAPPRARPGDSVTINVQTESPVDIECPGVVHLWAVDEGVLLATTQPTPSPLAHFFAHWAAVVETADVFSSLLPDHKRPASMRRIGAGWDDEETGREGPRRGPVTSRRRDAGVVWQESRSVGPDGSLSFPMRMPNLTGEMRLMAIAVDHDRYASAERALTLTAPLLVESAWPRFAAPGDEFKVPVKLFNATEGPLAVDLTVEAAGPIDLQAADSLTNIEVTPGVPATVWLSASVTDLGEVVAHVTATAAGAAEDGLSASSEATFPIRLATALHSTTSLLRVSAGESLAIEPEADLIPETTRTRLCISARPDVELLPAVREVVGYPYGCVEQTTSKLYALLHAGGVFAEAGQADAQASQVPEMIQAGIARLWSMQTLSGGLAYWPGSSSPDLWGSVYAASFLADAREVGHEIDARFHEGLTRYLGRRLNDDGNGEPDGNTRAAICRVLAAFDQPQEGWMVRLAERPDQLDIAGRAHLAAAFLATGKRDRAAAVLADDTLAQSISMTTSGRITSQVRQEGVLLSVLLDIDQQHPWVPTLVRRLEAARVNGLWGNTLESATALSALARYQAVATEEVAFDGTIDIPGSDRIPFSHLAPAVHEFAGITSPVVIETSGSGSVFVSVTMEGMSREGSAPTYDRQLEVRRRWTDHTGQAIDPADLQVGDLVQVEVTLAAPQLDRYASVGNVAVVDALPAGLEVENPRLATSARSKHEPSDQPDRVEFLDDRVLIFASARRKPQVFRYTLRAIAEGEFVIPPIQASSMYDTSFASIHGGGRLEIGQ